MPMNAMVAHLPSVIIAQADTPALDTGDTAWMLTSTALVLMMTIPGLALFYGGLVRSKNVLSTIMHSFFCAGLISIVWVAVGYSIAFGPSGSNWVGGFEYVGLRGLLWERADVAPTIPHLLFVAFQGTFAIITPALISGALAERMRFRAYALFIGLWSVIIYAPLCYWVWGGGWIGGKLGALDFAGGTVVHIASGSAALVCALYLGRRVGHGSEPMPPHNLPLTALGAALLWVGWFGFNAGSALGANDVAVIAFINTNTAAAAGVLGWLVFEYFRTGKPTVLGAASGAVAGLVAITPAAGFVAPWASIPIGMAGGAACYAAVSLKSRFRYDDALDVVGIHGVGGILGALATGIFATAAVNPAVTELTFGLDGGLIEGHAVLLWRQLLAIIATIAFCGLGTWILLIVTNAVAKVRVEHKDEVTGLDISQHSERAYSLVESGGQVVSAEAEKRKALRIPLRGERFTMVVDGVEPEELISHWRHLCVDYGVGVSSELKELYGSFTTVRGNRFNFRGGDKEQIRSTLERLFQGVAKSAKVRIDP